MKNGRVIFNRYFVLIVLMVLPIFILGMGGVPKPIEKVSLPSISGEQLLSVQVYTDKDL